MQILLSSGLHINYLARLSKQILRFAAHTSFLRIQRLRALLPYVAPNRILNVTYSPLNSGRLIPQILTFQPQLRIFLVPHLLHSQHVPYLLE